MQPHFHSTSEIRHVMGKTREISLLPHLAFTDNKKQLNLSDTQHSGLYWSGWESVGRQCH